MFEVIQGNIIICFLALYIYIKLFERKKTELWFLWMITNGPESYCMCPLPSVCGLRMSLLGCSVILVAGRDSKRLGRIPGCADNGSLNVMCWGWYVQRFRAGPLPRLGN